MGGDLLGVWLDGYYLDCKNAHSSITKADIQISSPLEGGKLINASAPGLFHLRGSIRQGMLVKGYYESLIGINEKMLQCTVADNPACVRLTIETFNQIHIRFQCYDKIT